MIVMDRDVGDGFDDGDGFVCRDGSYLASAGDDRTVLLWQLSHDSKPITPFGVDAPPCVENYRCVANLLGHEAGMTHTHTYTHTYAHNPVHI